MWFVLEIFVRLILVFVGAIATLVALAIVGLVAVGMIILRRKM